MLRFAAVAVLMPLLAVGSPQVNDGTSLVQLKTRAGLGKGLHGTVMKGTVSIHGPKGPGCSFGASARGKKQEKSLTWETEQSVLRLFAAQKAKSKHIDSKIFSFPMLLSFDLRGEDEMTMKHPMNCLVSLLGNEDATTTNNNCWNLQLSSDGNIQYHKYTPVSNSNPFIPEDGPECTSYAFESLNGPGGQIKYSEDKTSVKDLRPCRVAAWSEPVQVSADISRDAPWEALLHYVTELDLVNQMKFVTGMKWSNWWVKGRNNFQAAVKDQISHDNSDDWWTTDFGPLKFAAFVAKKAYDDFTDEELLDHHKFHTSKQDTSNQDTSNQDAQMHEDIKTWLERFFRTVTFEMPEKIQKKITHKNFDWKMGKKWQNQWLDKVVNKVPGYANTETKVSRVTFNLEFKPASFENLALAISGFQSLGS